MKVPGPQVNRQIAVADVDLGFLGEADLEDGAFEARADDDAPPVFLEQVLDELAHDVLMRFEVGMACQRAVRMALDFVAELAVDFGGRHG